MENDISTLSYSFFFLFRQDLSQLEPDEKFHLPDLPRNDLMKNGILVDEDKLLISRSFAQLPIEEYLIHLTAAWQEIVGQHELAYATALLGVAMVMMDDSLDHHAVTIPVSGDHLRQNLTFKRSGKILFTIQDQPSEMPMPAGFESFASEVGMKYRHYLEFQKHQVVLKPISGAVSLQDEGMIAPIFAVYGFQHQGIKEAENKSWPAKLQEFLTGKGAQSQELGALTRIVSRLIMRQWQFIRIDCAATELRNRLRQNKHYRSVSHTELVCQNSRQIERELETINDHIIQVKFMEGRLRQAMKTLEINRNNLKQTLQEIQEQGKAQQWLFTWQTDHQPALLETFASHIRTLGNHQTYLEGEMSHLEGLQRRWHLALENRRLELSEHIGTLGHVLILLVALGEISNITAHPPEKSLAWLPTWFNDSGVIEVLSPLLHNAGVYLLVIVIFLAYALLPVMRNWIWKRIHCLWHRWVKHD